MIIAWDPGEKNIGCAMFSYDEKERKANLLFKRILDRANMYGVLELAEKMLAGNENVKHTFVIENFRIDPNNVANRNVGRGGRSSAMFQWSEVETAQVIGTLRYAAHRMNQSDVVMQEPTILAMGRKWCDFKVPKGHIPDDISAYIHGLHYMIKFGLIDSPDDVIRNGQTKLG